MTKLTDEEREQVAKLTAELRKVPGLDATANVLNLLVVRLEAAERHVEALQEKQLAETCACSHDSATDVCLGHSPMLRAERDRAEALAAHVERLKEVAEQLELADNQSEFNQSANRLWRTVGEAPKTSLARHDAELLQWAVDHVRAGRDHEFLRSHLSDIDARIAELRRQAGERV